MICPKCGGNIPEGKMYCEKCGTEIKIVKEFDAGLEQKISANMDSIRDEVRRQIEEEEENKAKIQEAKIRKREMIMVFSFLSLILLVVILIAVYIFNPSESRCVGIAYEAAQKGDYDKAVSYIDKAIKKANEEDARELGFTKAAYLIDAGNTETARQTIQSIIEDAGSTNDQIIDGYQQLIDIYSASNQFETIAEIIDGSPDFVKEKFSDYLSTAPTFSEDSGEYDDSIDLVLDSESGGSIFYTLDGTVPDMQSAIYTEPLRLTSGDYFVTALTVNKYGVASEPVTKKYRIGSAKPDAPEIETESGSYEGATLIKVKTPENGKVYYTTDETDPTENSDVYTSPIQMPSGESTYRFAVIDENGNISDIVEREYEMTPAAEITINEGPAYIIAAMMREGQVIDMNGTVSGGNARYEYDYAGTKTLPGYGSFYVYNEILVDAAGKTASTGRKFAVNISNAIVNYYKTTGQIVPING